MKRVSLSSAELIAGNQDLLTEILIRIPAKPLLKFKCVSKQWLSLISDPRFCILHACHHRVLNPTPNALLLNNFYSSTPTFQFVPLMGDDASSYSQVAVFDYLNVSPNFWLKIKNSCNGLILCMSIFYGGGFDDAGSELKGIICNPTTKQFKTLSFPVPKFRDSKTYSSFYGLAFDPLKSQHYKIICLHVDYRGSKNPQIYLYSSLTNSWSFWQNSLEAPTLYGFVNGVFCNDAIHWCSYEQTTLYFDVNTESLKIMPMPPIFSTVNRSREFMYFGESRGRLHMAGIRSHFISGFDVWEMASDYSGWSLLFHVNLRSVKRAFPKKKFDSFTILNVLRAEKEEESKVVISVDSTAMSLNILGGTLKTLSVLEPGLGFPADLGYEGHDAFQYFQSLVCV
ncbi:hypothetical protein OIU84_017653 [Salix udensis]|uniref:F-box domain-containing protein n=1 Tax=Salix udensis TaxID=889485 RepID=A0AAD6L2C6_9ROSI|nr:hypothetical protein OIU84_017653 [Salix udensis]